MFRIDNYMEDWAKAYIPLSHTAENPSFFRMNDMFALDEFLQNFHDLEKPVCGVVTHLEGDLNVPKRVQTMNYTCVFLARADETDYQAQADAKEKAWQLMWAFLAKLYMDKTTEQEKGLRTPLSQLKMDSLRADTLGPMVTREEEHGEVRKTSNKKTTNIKQKRR